MSQLTALPNIGETIAQQLEEIGVENEAQLCALGSREAWLRIKARDPSACYMRLCALEGAIQKMRWHHLSPECKAELKAFFNQHKG